MCYYWCGSCMAFLVTCFTITFVINRLCGLLLRNQMRPSEIIHRKHIEMIKHVGCLFSQAFFSLYVFLLFRWFAKKSKMINSFFNKYSIYSHVEIPNSNNNIIHHILYVTNFPSSLSLVSFPSHSRYGMSHWCYCCCYDCYRSTIVEHALKVALDVSQNRSLHATMWKELIIFREKNAHINNTVQSRKS